MKCVYCGKEASYTEGRNHSGLFGTPSDHVGFCSKHYWEVKRQRDQFDWEVRMAPYFLIRNLYRKIKKGLLLLLGLKQ